MKYTLEKFKEEAEFQQPVGIMEDDVFRFGYLSSSTILSTLIQQAGRFAESHASDLFIEWKSVEKKIFKMADGECADFMFGIRAQGVDGTDEILCRLNGGHKKYFYRCLYVLTAYKDSGNCSIMLRSVHIF